MVTIVPLYPDDFLSSLQGAQRRETGQRQRPVPLSTPWHARPQHTQCLSPGKERGPHERHPGRVPIRPGHPSSCDNVQHIPSGTLLGDGPRARSAIEGQEARRQAAVPHRAPLRHHHPTLGEAPRVHRHTAAATALAPSLHRTRGQETRKVPRRGCPLDRQRRPAGMARPAAGRPPPHRPPRLRMWHHPPSQRRGDRARDTPRTVHRPHGG